MATTERSKGAGSLFQRAERGPWIGAYTDWNGKRVIKSTRTTDKAAAGRIVSRWVADAALKREGVIDPTLAGYADAGRLDLAKHADEYFTHCERVGIDDEHLASKRYHLRRVREVARITRLNELTVDAVERYLRSIKDAGRSARSVNFARTILVTFVSWCAKTGRTASNHLKAVPKQDESNDRRRVRRPLSDDELARLVQVGRERGRGAWYLLAALAGLRRGDLKRLVWSDVNFRDATITVRGGKAKRIDVLSMHPQLAEVLQRLHGEAKPMPTDRVFPEAVTNRTRTLDFLRAGIARQEVVLGADGKPVMVGKGKRRRPETRITCIDDDGRVADLHCLRVTLGTNLARAGVVPQVATRVMRHASYATTLKYYTVLTLADSAKAIGKIPAIGTPVMPLPATGTHAQ